MTTPLLELRHVSKNHQSGRLLGGRLLGAALQTKSLAHIDIPVITDLSLSIDSAEIVALVGESGAGKSTLARLVLGLEQPDRGTVTVDGVDFGQLSGRKLRQMRQQMHLILQDPYQSLHPSMRVAQLVAEPLVIAQSPKEARAKSVIEALQVVGIDPPDDFLTRFPHQLSGGQRQRVALARALVARPKLIIADEPTSMLDASLQETILTLIEWLRSEYQIAFLFITHDLRLAEQISDRVAVMHRGSLVEIGTTDAVINQPQHAYTQRLLAANEQFI